LWNGLCFAAGALIAGGIFLLYTNTHTAAPAQALRESDINPSTQYKFIDPLVGLQTANQAVPADYRALQDSVEAYVKSQEQAGDLTTASVNFKDIKNGGFTLNPQEEYNPASLFKVPVMMTVFELAEKNPSILDKSVTYDGGPDLNSNEQIQPSIKITPGTSYTLGQLVEHMVRYSDNNALSLLGQILDTDAEAGPYQSLVKDLGVGTAGTPDDKVTVQGYSLFFRALYNATYLDRDYSQKALELLSQADFNKGIKAGLPSDMVVAHKFGEYGVEISGTKVLMSQELHDCGIVYYPGHPYHLCIMTKGKTIAQLEQIISHISAMIYGTVNKLYPS
jgi:beta-lactamase class A